LIESLFGVFFDGSTDIVRYLQHIQCCIKRQSAGANKVCNARGKGFNIPFRTTFCSTFYDSLLFYKVTVITHLIESLPDVGCYLQTTFACKVELCFYRHIVIEYRRKETNHVIC